MKWLLELPLVIGLPVFVAIIVITGSLIFILVHKYVIKPAFFKVHYNVTKLLFRSSASLLSLLLSFTLANQRSEYFALRSSLQEEAALLVDIHMDLEYYNSPEASALQKDIRNHIKIEVEEGWEPLVKSPFESQTFNSFREIYGKLLQLEAINPTQVNLKQSLLSDADAVSDFMQVRFYKSRPETSELFYLSFFGFVIVMVLFATYTPDKITLLFISLYNIFIGSVLYFIILMNNPLAGPLKVKAEPFHILKETIDKVFEE